MYLHTRLLNATYDLDCISYVSIAFSLQNNLLLHFHSLDMNIEHLICDLLQIHMLYLCRPYIQRHLHSFDNSHTFSNISIPTRMLYCSKLAGIYHRNRFMLMSTIAFRKTWTEREKDQIHWRFWYQHSTRTQTENKLYSPLALGSQGSSGSVETPNQNETKQLSRLAISTLTNQRASNRRVICPHAIQLVQSYNTPFQY